MFFLKKLFHRKKIVETEILEEIDGLSDNEQLDNLFLGNYFGGPLGMVLADDYNNSNDSQTTFRVYYSDKTYKEITVNNHSKEYKYYIKFLK